MTQEDKELLLKDLCARLPYGIIMRNRECENDFELDGRTELTLTQSIKYSIEKFRAIPYLRPMSSMTEEEEREVQILWNVDFYDKNSWYHCYPRTADFYHSRHLDYRGLIPKGLAIEAPEGMYK